MKIKKENIFLVLIIAVAAGFSFWCLHTNPPSWFDEGIYHQITRNIAEDGRWGMQLAPGEYGDFSLISVGYPVFYPASVVFKLVGSNFATLRLIAIGFLLAFVLVQYLFARELFNSKVALWTSALLVTFSPLYGHGKNFLGEVPGLLYFVLGLLFLTLMEEGKRAKLYALLSGIAFGLAISSKPVYVLILAATGLAAVIEYKKYLLNRSGVQLTVLFLLGIIPTLLLWVYTQFGGGTGFTRIMEHYSNPNNVETNSYVVSNLLRFFSESTPVHFAFFLIVAVLFLLYKKIKKQPVKIAEYIILFFSIFIFVTYLRTVGWYRYLFPAQALLLVFLPAALSNWSAKLNFLKGKPYLLLPLVCLTVLGAHLIPLVQERISCSRFDAPTYYGNEVFPELLKTKHNSAFFFYNLPHLAARLGEFKNYYQYVRMNDILDFGEKNVVGIEKEKYSVILVPSNELEIIKKIPPCYQQEDSYRGVIMYTKTKECLK